MLRVLLKGGKVLNRANRYRKNKKKNIFSSLFGRKKSDKVKNKINHADSGQKRTRQINAVDDPRNPLWKKNPDKYAPQKPLWQRFFIKLGSIFLFWFLIFGVVAVLVGGEMCIRDR